MVMKHCTSNEFNLTLSLSKQGGRPANMYFFLFKAEQLHLWNIDFETSQIRDNKCEQGLKFHICLNKLFLSCLSLRTYFMQQAVLSFSVSYVQQGHGRFMFTDRKHFVEEPHPIVCVCINLVLSKDIGLTAVMTTEVSGCQGSSCSHSQGKWGGRAEYYGIVGGLSTWPEVKCFPALQRNGCLFCCLNSKQENKTLQIEYLFLC